MIHDVDFVQLVVPAALGFGGAALWQLVAAIVPMLYRCASRIEGEKPIPEQVTPYACGCAVPKPTRLLAIGDVVTVRATIRGSQVDSYHGGLRFYVQVGGKDSYTATVSLADLDDARVDNQ